MKRLKAFTIMELIVGMIISAIVLAICFYSLIIFSAENRKMSIRATRMNAFLQFKNVLSADFQKSGEIKISGNKIRLFRGETDASFLSGSYIDYMFDSVKLIRAISSGEDTIYLKNRIISISTVSPTSETVSKIQWEVYMDGETVSFCVCKNYSAMELLEAEKKQNDGRY